MPAPALESIVLDGVCSFLGDQKRLSGLVANLSAGEITTLFGRATELAGAIRQGATHAQREVLLDIVAGIEIDQGRIIIRLRAEALRECLKIPAANGSDEGCIEIPVAFRRRGVETRLVWWNRFGPMFAAEICKRRVQHRAYSQWRWHLDEVFVRINGEMYYLWRAVDHEGEVLEAYATKRRDRKAALGFLKRVMKRYGRPNSIVTDRLKSYRAAMVILGNAGRQVVGKWLNNRAENSHQPFRRREGAMAKFKDVKTLQKFSSVSPRPDANVYPMSIL